MLRLIALNESSLMPVSLHLIRAAKKARRQKSQNLSETGQAIGAALEELNDVNGAESEDPFADLLKRLDASEQK
jgi:hypothetical protein